MSERTHNFGAFALAGAAILISALALSRPVQVNVPNPVSGNLGAGITVSGDGIVHATPDIAIIDFGTQSSAATVEEARAAAATAATQILKALKDAGISDADVQTTNLSLYPRYPDYRSPCPPEQPVDAVGGGSSSPTIDPATPPDANWSYQPSSAADGREFIASLPCVVDLSVPNGWTYSQSFEVTIRDIDQAGSVLDAVTAAGVNQIGGIRFDIADRDALIAQARDAAVKAARSKAEATTKAAGVQLGELLSISETTNYPGPYYSGRDAVGGGEKTPVAPGQLDITVTVNLSFALN